MKNIFALLALIAIFSIASVQDASAQFNFFNGTPCAVQVYAGYTDGPSPCFAAIPVCNTGWITVPPGPSIIPGPPCYFGWIGPAAFYGYRLRVSPTNQTSVDLCSGAVSPILDCGGIPRTVQILNTTSGAIF